MNEKKYKINGICRGREKLKRLCTQEEKEYLAQQFFIDEKIEAINKKSNERPLTFKELGELYALQLALDKVKKRTAQGPEIKVDFDSLNNRINENMTPADATTLNEYLNIDIFNQLMERETAAAFKELSAAVEKLKSKLQELNDNAIFRKTIAQTMPLYLTEKEYKELKENADHRLKEGRYSLKWVFVRTLFAFTLAPNIAPPEIQRELEALEQQPATNEKIKRCYLEKYGAGYYMTDPFGNKSKEFLTPNKKELKAWADYVNNYLIETHELSLENVLNNSIRLLEDKRKKYLYMPESKFIKEFKKVTGQKVEPGDVAALKKDLEKLKVKKLVLDDTTQDYIPLYEVNGTNVLTLLEYKRAFFCKIIKRGQKVTKLDLLKKWRASYGRYDYTNSPQEKAQFLEFIKDYPHFFKAMKGYLMKDFKAAGQLDPEQWGNVFYSANEIRQTKTIIAQAIEPDKVGKDLIILEYNRLDKEAAKPISVEVIITEEAQKRRLLAKTMAAIYEQSKELNLNNFTNKEMWAQQLQGIYNEIAAPLEVLYKYNASVEALAQALKLKELNGLKYPEYLINTLLNEANSVLYALYFNITGTTEEKQNLEKEIKDTFEPLEPVNYAPTKTSKRQLKKYIQENGTSKDATEYFKILKTPRRKKIE